MKFDNPPLFTSEKLSHNALDAAASEIRLRAFIHTIPQIRLRNSTFFIPETTHPKSYYVLLRRVHDMH